MTRRKSIIPYLTTQWKKEAGALVLSKKFKEEKNRELSTASAKVGRNADNRQTNRQPNLIRSTGGRGGEHSCCCRCNRNCSNQFSLDQYRYTFYYKNVNLPSKQRWTKRLQHNMQHPGKWKPPQSLYIYRAEYRYKFVVYGSVPLTDGSGCGSEKA